MPHTEHRKKTQRHADEAREINRGRRSAARTAVKGARAAVAGGPDAPKDVAKAVHEAMTAVDKAASYGVYHPNKASRLKSRLAKALNRTKAAAPK